MSKFKAAAFGSLGSNGNRKIVPFAMAPSILMNLGFLWPIECTWLCESSVPPLLLRRGMKASS
jgi:hypothetical protein